MREVSSQPWKRKEEGGREREKEDRVSDEEGEEGEESKEEKQESCEHPTENKEERYHATNEHYLLPPLIVILSILSISISFQPPPLQCIYPSLFLSFAPSPSHSLQGGGGKVKDATDEGVRRG